MGRQALNREIRSALDRKELSADLAERFRLCALKVNDLHAEAALYAEDQSKLHGMSREDAALEAFRMYRQYADNEGALAESLRRPNGQVRAAINDLRKKFRRFVTTENC